MMSNYDGNKKAIDAFRKELRAMFKDISEIDTKILNRAVSEGVAVAKRNTHVVSSFMRKSWRSTPTVKSVKGVEKSIANFMDYSSFVNDGHRKVNRAGETTGWVQGQFMLEKAIHKVDLVLLREFKKEVERVNKKHDK